MLTTIRRVLFYGCSLVFLWAFWYVHDAPRFAVLAAVVLVCSAADVFGNGAFR